MGRRFHLAVWVILLFTLGPALAGTANRAISLKVLESRLKAGPSQEIERFCGITKVTGFLVDKTSGDVIVIGKVDPAWPPLHLDDFVVAIRNVRMAYAQRKGNAVYYTPPGCSIDPEKSTLQALQAVGKKLNQVSGTEAQKSALDEWHSVGGRPQRVRVLGVPFDTHFAKVMVDADYYMKRLVDGSVKLDIPGFESLTDASIRLDRDDFHANRPPSGRGSCLNRFWFCPGESDFTDEDGVVLLQSCPVKLLTEQEFLTSKGELSGAGRPDPLAGMFAESFTRKYAEIASVRPIYKDLQGLYRFMALARLLEDHKAFSAVATRLRHLTNGHKVASVPVPRTVRGLTRVVESREEKDTPEGTVTMTTQHMTCGGVNMDVRPKKARLVTAPSSGGPRPGSGQVFVKAERVLRKSVLGARKSKSQLFWDFPSAD